MSSNPINEQDWIPVVLKKNKTNKQTQKQIDPIVKKMNQLENSDEIIKVTKVSDDDRKMISNLRLLKKISQKDLANKLQIREDIIKSIENGTHSKDNQLITRIKTFLIKLPILKNN
jgi:ribosome-binding protein aMBF1 (putative translation factor)